MPDRRRCRPTRALIALAAAAAACTEDSQPPRNADAAVPPDDAEVSDAESDVDAGSTDASAGPAHDAAQGSDCNDAPACEGPAVDGPFWLGAGPVLYVGSQDLSSPLADPPTNRVVRWQPGEEPTELVASQQLMLPAFVFDGRLYFLALDSVDDTYTLQRVSVEVPAAAPEVVATGVERAWASAEHVYWTHAQGPRNRYLFGSYELWRWDGSAGAPSRAAEIDGLPLGADEQRVVYDTYDETRERLSTLVADLAALDQPRVLNTWNDVYFKQRYDHEVRLHEGAVFAGDFSLDSHLHRLELDGSGDTPLPAPGTNTSGSPLVFAGDYVYWVDWVDSVTSPGCTYRRVALTGGVPPEELTHTDTLTSPCGAFAVLDGALVYAQDGHVFTTPLPAP